MPITIRVERTDDSRRWVRISLSARTPKEEERPVAYSNWFCCSIQPLDNVVENHHLEVWESGIISGLAFVFRRSTITGVMVHSIEGQLSHEDVEGVAYATIAALIPHADRGIAIPTSKNWVVKNP